jgi:hypothetical protein
MRDDGFRVSGSHLIFSDSLPLIVGMNHQVTCRSSMHPSMLHAMVPLNRTNVDVRGRRMRKAMPRSRKTPKITVHRNETDQAHCS